MYLCNSEIIAVIVKLLCVLKYLFQKKYNALSSTREKCNKHFPLYAFSERVYVCAKLKYFLSLKKFFSTLALHLTDSIISAGLINLFDITTKNLNFHIYFESAHDQPIF